MEDKPISKKDILEELDEIQSKDHKYSDGRILGSMCTEAHPFAKEVYCKFLDSNLGPNRSSTDERGLGQREGEDMLIEGGRKAAPKRVKVP